MKNKDAFDLWWEWADKPVDNKPTIDAAIYDAVMALPPDERRDRAKVNVAVREGLALGRSVPPAMPINTAFPKRQSSARVTRQQKITLGEMRSSGVRGLLVYCADYQCAHAVRIGADRWPDHTRLSDLEPLFVYQACGRRGADIRPDWDWGLSRRRASG
jgi:hypothetical protein